LRRFRTVPAEKTLDAYLNQHCTVMRGDIRLFDRPAQKGFGQLDHVRVVEFVSGEASWRLHDKSLVVVPLQRA
jgi:hypothetical protein